MPSQKEVAFLFALSCTGRVLFAIQKLAMLVWRSYNKYSILLERISLLKKVLSVLLIVCCYSERKEKQTNRF